MKKLGLLLVCGSMMMATTGCKESPQQKAEKQLAAVVAMVKVPYEVDSTTTLTSITLADHVLTSRIRIPAARLAKINPDTLTSAQIQNLATNLTSRKVREVAVAAGVSLRYVYYNDKDSVVLTISPEALAK